MPITPFIGVRISWLMTARKSLLARSAALSFFRKLLLPNHGSLDFADILDLRDEMERFVLFVAEQGNAQ